MASHRVHMTLRWLGDVILGIMGGLHKYLSPNYNRRMVVIVYRDGTTDCHYTIYSYLTGKY
jgi:hypothetical protein